ncbi:MAG: hypothetical protein RL758_2211 [Pseudomonadota bacterium]|jgi:anti-anti-sigma regulatory factor
MAKADPPGGFLSKVARFVRHPTVDWSELEAPSTGVDEERAALKAALQRKRRNDRVRHHELNTLRELMNRQRAEAQAGAAADSASLVPPSVGASSDKSRTIEQIARIEEQMAAHWQQRQGSGAGAGATIPARLESGVTVPAHLRARQGGSTTFPMTIDMVTEDPNLHAPDWDAALSHATVAEAAVRFANGQAAEAQKALRALMAQEGLSPTARAAAVVLLDILHAGGDLEGFEELAAEYAERFGVPVPAWPQPSGALSGETAAAPAPADRETPAGGVQPWTCPMLLDASAVESLQHLTASSNGTKWLDWTHLVSADEPAARALLQVVEVWLERPVEFHMRGAAVLRRRLKASTPSGRDENDKVWWLLRLALLRLMRRRDEFDLAALDYCVTYGVLPPEWVEPVCRFQVAESVPVVLPEWDAGSAGPAGEPIQPLSTQLAGLDVHEWPALATTTPSETLFPALPSTQSLWPATQPSGVALHGVLTGDVTQALAALDAALANHPVEQPFRIDCRSLLRVDFAAAGSLLQWFMATGGRGLQVVLIGVSPLIGAFFHVVGIDEAVTVRLRQY